MKKALTSIWFLAFVITCPVVYFMPPLFEKYRIEEEKKEAIPPSISKSTVYYNDLYGNNEKSRILAKEITFFGEKKLTANYALDRAGILFYGQPHLSVPHLFFGDTDGDKLMEIFAFSSSGDSVFVNRSNLGDKNRRNVLHPPHYLVPFVKNAKFQRISTNSVLFTDVDKDGFDEFVFPMSFGIDSTMSAVFIFDAQENTISRTATVNGRLNKIQAFDINNDGTNEIIACGNYSDYENSDKMDGYNSFSYIMLIDVNREMSFEMIKYPQAGSIETLPKKEGNTSFLYVLKHREMETGNNSILYKLNSANETIDSILINVSRKTVMPTLSSAGNGDIFIHADQGKIHIVNSNMQLINTVNLGDDSKHLIVYFDKDINEDGTKDFLCWNYQTYAVSLFTDRFTHKTTLGQWPGGKTLNNYKLKKNSFFVYNDTHSVIFSFKKNPYRLFQYPTYLGIYLLIVLLGYVFRKTQEARLKEKYELKNKVLHLQLQNLNNQLDPHFTFNVLNSVGNAIYKQDKEAAYDLFQSFTRIIRSSLMSSDKVFRTLQEELQFTQDYLDFQKLRFKNRFTYTIDVQQGIETQNILFPKMLIQSFAENTVKHAFYEANYIGQILIKVAEENQTLKVSIADNGIGINKSKEIEATSGTKKGVRILKDQIRKINLLYHSAYKLSISDKSETGKGQTGTLITISFPKDHSISLS